MIHVKGFVFLWLLKDGAIDQRPLEVLKVDETPLLWEENIRYEKWDKFCGLSTLVLGQPTT
jgi:hypothetical protein